jgi:hypothetical protein
MATGRHVHHRRRAAVLITVAVAAGVALLVFGGGAFAAIRYEHTHANRIAPGVTIRGNRCERHDAPRRWSPFTPR